MLKHKNKLKYFLGHMGKFQGSTSGYIVISRLGSFASHIRNQYELTWQQGNFGGWLVR